MAVSYLVQKTMSLMEYFLLVYMPRPQGLSRPFRRLLKEFESPASRRRGTPTQMSTSEG